MSDPTIEQIEAELRESRFGAWDVETFLANRHQAKIDALTASKSKWRTNWYAAKELLTLLFAYLGMVSLSVTAAVWLLTGELPWQKPPPDVVITPIPPPPACPAP